MNDMMRQLEAFTAPKTLDFTIADLWISQLETGRGFSNLLDLQRRIHPKFSTEVPMGATMSHRQQFEDPLTCCQVWAKEPQLTLIPWKTMRLPNSYVREPSEVTAVPEELQSA